MKKLIRTINTRLLEKHPIIWNTRLLWMILISIFIHLCFFTVGFSSVSNAELFHKRGADRLFFNNGGVFFGILISILLLVVWLFYLFKNNSFKSYYPTSRLQLFKQFICYLVIILSATAFYYSYMAGVKFGVSQTYKDEQIAKEIALTNKAAIFFSHNLQDYTPSKIRYPKFFDSLYCEDNEQFIDTSKSYFTSLGVDYQFYSLKTKTYKYSQTYRDSIFANHVGSTQLDSSMVYYFKDTVVDVSKHLITKNPSYYNFSHVFFSEENEYGINYYDNGSYLEETYYEDSNEYDDFTEKRHLLHLQNKQGYELLKRNNPTEIKQILSDFLRIADTHQISYNLDVNTWFDIIYQPDKFEVTGLIRRLKKDSKINSRVYETGMELTPFQSHAKAIQTNYHIETNKLYNTYENIYEIKDKKIFDETLHAFLWIAFTLACFIFAFRVSGLKTLLFSIIGFGVLWIIIALIGTLFSFLNTNGPEQIDLFIEYLCLAIGTAVLIVPLFFLDKVKKVVSGVFLNISIWGFVLYVFLILLIIDTHQNYNCFNEPGVWVQGAEECFRILHYLEENLSYLLFAVGLIFIYLYSGIIKKWKALPEN